MKLVTIATYYEPTQAHIALNQLEAEGIRAVLENESLLQNVWVLGQAVGQIRLSVSDSDAQRAVEVLEQVSSIPAVELDDIAKESTQGTEESRPIFKHFYQDIESEDEEVLRNELSEQDTRIGMEDSVEEAEPNAKEMLAVRALRGSLITFLFLPLAFLVTYVLFQILLSEEPLRPEYRKKAVWACILNIPVMLLLLIAIRSFVMLLLF